MKFGNDGFDDGLEGWGEADPEDDYLGDMAAAAAPADSPAEAPDLGPMVQVVEFVERPGERYYIEGYDGLDRGGKVEDTEGFLGTIASLATAPLKVASTIAKPVSAISGRIGSAVGGAVGGRAGARIGGSIGRTAGGLATRTSLGIPPSLATFQALRQLSPSIRKATRAVEPYVREFGARGVADLIGTGRAQRVATPGVGSEPHLQRVAAQVAARVMPALKNIEGRLATSAVQTEATSEHHTLVNQKEFRQKVLGRLASLERACPNNSPQQQQIQRLGVMARRLGYRS